MRIAWLGPIGEDGGVPSLGTLLLTGVLDHGAEVDFFTEAGAALPPSLSSRRNLTAVGVPTWWRWGKWYSRHPMSSYLSGTFARTQVHGRICDALLERHRARPYDCVFQLSQSELFKLARHVDELPPVVIFPCVHAAGELRWHRRESAYALQSERRLMHYAVRLLLCFRTFVQRRQIQKPALILGLSKRFNELLVEDYGVPPERLKVLYHPIRTARAADPPVAGASVPGKPRASPLKLLFVGRISVRKGIEQIVELSRRLDDLHGQVQMDVVGNRTQWSDYTAHLKELNPRIARFVGQIAHRDMPAAYDDADILLVPSMYEPGGLVVGEALSRGVCVVASDEVGSAEPIAADCCRRFPAGDVDALERRTRTLIDDLRRDPATLRRRAADEAASHFAPDAAARRLLSLLAACASTPVARDSTGPRRLPLAASR